MNLMSALKTIVDNAPMLFEGYMMNILITVVACILPLAIGIPLTIPSKFSPTVSKILSFVSLPFECISPLLFSAILLYFIVPSTSRALMWVVFAFALSTSFLLYMPAHFQPEYSMLKNILYNGLGLIQGIFLWSFTASFFGIRDLMRIASNLFALTFNGVGWVVPFVVAFATLFVIGLARRLIKNFMK